MCSVYFQKDWAITGLSEQLLCLPVVSEACAIFQKL